MGLPQATKKHPSTEQPLKSAQGEETTIRRPVTDRSRPRHSDRWFNPNDKRRWVVDQVLPVTGRCPSAIGSIAIRTTSVSQKAFGATTGPACDVETPWKEQSCYRASPERPLLALSTICCIGRSFNVLYEVFLYFPNAAKRDAPNPLTQQHLAAVLRNIPHILGHGIRFRQQAIL
jgi:hypothetical protein